MDKDDNGWNEYQQLVLDTLKRHNEKLTHMCESIQEINIRLTELNAEILGIKIKTDSQLRFLLILGAAIPTAITLAVQLIFFK